MTPSSPIEPGIKGCTFKCAVKPDNFSVISCLNPVIINNDSNITHKPNAMPTIAIFTIGTDADFVASPFNNLRAMYHSRFIQLKIEN